MTQEPIVSTTEPVMIPKVHVIVMAAVVGLMTPAMSRADGFDSLEESLTRLVTSSGLVNLSGYRYDGNQCLFGYLLDQGKEQTMVRTFERNKTYLILGAGDDDARDIDLWVTQEDQPGAHLCEDIDDDATPMVEFQPTKTGRYAVQIRNEESHGPSFCGFIVLVKDDHAGFGIVPLAEALDNATAVARLRGLFAKEFPRNNLVLFGGECERGESSTVYNLSYTSGDYVAVASGSDSIEDVDLTVTRQFRADAPQGAEVAGDRDDDNTPAAPFRITKGSYYCVSMKNEQCVRSGFIFGFVLRDD
jgi:hypothetical protein